MPPSTPSELWVKLKPLAREKRTSQTAAEKVLWAALRAHRFSGCKFRRQHAIGRFIVDFYCSKSRLVIEVDGPIHRFSRTEDEERQAYLESLGLRVLRFGNQAVLGDTERILIEPREALGTSSP